MARLSEYIIDKLNNGVSGATERFIDRLHAESEHYANIIEDRILNLQKRVMKSVIYTLTYTATGVLGLLAVFYALKEYALLSNTFSFLIIGVITFIIGLIVSLQVKGGKYRNYG